MNKPFILSPAVKEYIWGGRRIDDCFRKGIKRYPVAETWECSTHPDGQSRVGEESLGTVLNRHPEYLGAHAIQLTDGKTELPILIKIIDANKDLSVQVHPNDEYAWEHEGEPGKTEMWYVLKAREGSELIYGFNQDVSREQIRLAIQDGSIRKYLNRVPIHKGDLFYIEAGIVHAIGAGALIAEIQESSNVTYRLFDYNRSDENGKKRELHIDKALDVANLKASATPRQPMRELKYRKGYASELLTRCKYFVVERLLLNTEVNRNLTDFRTGSNSFHVLLCIEGCGVLCGKDFMLNFFKGDCIFVPADSIPLKLHGKAELLNVSC